MSIQNRDTSLAKEPGRRYYAAVPAHLLDPENRVLDELIGFAFGTLGACHLDVRVYDETAIQALVEGECSCQLASNLPAVRYNNPT